MTHTPRHARTDLRATRLHKREKFEVIIDTCCYGERVMRSVEKLTQHAVNAKNEDRPCIFSDYRITIPIQIGAERKRRIFPEFLDAELRSPSTKQSYLEGFYVRHHTHTRIVETDTSLGFKLYYAYKALGALHDNATLKEQILRDAGGMAERYAPFLDINRQGLTPRKLEYFLHSLQGMQQRHDAGIAKQAASIMRQHDGGIDDPKLLQTLKNAEHQYIAREAKEFLPSLTIEEKLLLQAMYSCSPLHYEVGRQKDFKRYRADKGERSIEEFLFDNRTESDPGRVTLIISDDQGARTNIQRLRAKSDNSIFAISNYGLTHAMRKLFPNEPKLGKIGPEMLELTQSRDARTQERIRKGKTIGMDDVIEPRIEEKWAERLVEVMKTGRWTESPSQQRGR